jgi:hypothetical protein
LAVPACAHALLRAAAAGIIAASLDASLQPRPHDTLRSRRPPKKRGTRKNAAAAGQAPVEEPSMDGDEAVDQEGSEEEALADANIPLQ